MSNYLIIVEGEKDEKRILENAFKRYGFNVETINEKLNIYDNQFSQTKLISNKSNVFIIQGPKNRVHELLKDFNKNQEDFEKYFNFQAIRFQGIFLLYDVDHNSNDDIEILMSKFNDEFSGMLLLSSPCIEVIGDYNRNRIECKWFHLSEYKSELNKH